MVLSIDPALYPDDLRNLMAHLTTIEVSDRRAYVFSSVLASTCSICGYSVIVFVVCLPVRMFVKGSTFAGCAFCATFQKL